MKRKTRQNPYRDFKSDLERRRALNSLAWSKAARAIGVALATTSAHWTELIRWLMQWIS
jgi:hypothetical protein